MKQYFGQICDLGIGEFPAYAHKIWYNNGMTTAELTANIDLLTAGEKRQVSHFVKSLLPSRRDIVPDNLPKYNTEDILRFVDESETEHQKGTLISYKKAITTARKKYEIPA